MDINQFWKAEQNYQYISSMRPVFNRKALFSDTTENYISPAEPSAYSEVTIRFRSAGESGLCPRPVPARRWRTAHRYGRHGGEPAVRRDRQSGVILYDRQAGRSIGTGTFLLSAVYFTDGLG